MNLNLVAPELGTCELVRLEGAADESYQYEMIIAGEDLWVKERAGLQPWTLEGRLLVKRSR
jgi:hypothetical protein